MELSWATAILVIVLVYLFYWWSKKSSNYWKENGVPEAKYPPLIGAVKDIIIEKKSFVDISKNIYKQFSKEKFCSYNILTTPVLLIRDIDLINQIMIKDFSHFQDRVFPGDEKVELNNETLANISGDKWKVLRHKLTPTFTSGKMKAMFEKMKECSEESALYLKYKQDVDIDSRDFLFKYMINVIADVSFGIKADAFNEEKENNNTFVKMSRKLFSPSTKFQVTMLLLSAAPGLKDFLKLRATHEDVDDFFTKLTLDLIKLRKENNEKRNDFLQLMLNEQQKELNICSTAADGKFNQEIPSNDDDDNETGDLELLEHLKNLKYDPKCQVFTDRSIAAQTMMFVAGGTETTAATLSFALYELAVNKDLQRKAQRIVDETIKSQGLTYQSVKKMTYLDQILNEVMRLRPAGGVLPRICTKDYKLPGTNLVIRKGMTVQFPVAAIHTDPEYFPDPNTFNPDRFENIEAIPKGAFLPFGGGPRICIAMRLAMLKMKIFLAVILSHYNIILSEKTKTPLKLDHKSFLQHVVGGLWLRFESRRN